MKYIRVVLGIIIGLLVITIVAEVIEFTLVKSVSGTSFEALQADEQEYFNVRNRTWILISKVFYSLIAGIFGGYITTWISKEKAKIAIYILLFFQIVFLIWAGFISELSETGPLWMWGYLLIIIPIGIWIGYRWKRFNAQKG
jgi:hypothetical protein